MYSFFNAHDAPQPSNVFNEPFALNHSNEAHLGQAGAFCVPFALKEPKMNTRKAHFKHFQALAPEVARIGLRRLILSIFRPWPKQWPE